MVLRDLVSWTLKCRFERSRGSSLGNSPIFPPEIFNLIRSIGGETIEAPQFKPILMNLSIEALICDILVNHN